MNTAFLFEGLLSSTYAGTVRLGSGVPLVVVACKSDLVKGETFDQQQRLHFVQQVQKTWMLLHSCMMHVTSSLPAAFA